MKIVDKVTASLTAFAVILSCNPVIATNDNSNNSTKDITFEQKIGINGLVDCEFVNLKVASIFREYHNFGWTYDSNSGKCYFKSSRYDFDEFYKNLYYSGITTLPCLIQGNNEKNRYNKPVKDGDDTNNVESYKVHSNVLFNYAARYGNTQITENRLNITTGTEAKTGLGYIKYYENWNEPDKDQLGEDAHFSAEEFSAMCSADYDGHEGTLGTNYGIKQADPTSKLVLGGLSNTSNIIDYLNGIKNWCNENRKSKTLPFDVINFHYYAGDKAPETSDFISKVNDLIKWRNENAPDKEIWLTEFGWDTNISSPHSATSSETQRDWIIRQFLLADKIGLNRSFVYSLRDNGNANSSSPSATSGLTTQKGKEERKSSWYGINTLKNTLTGFKFSGIIKEENNLYIYKYTNPSTAEECYALWCPTENGSKIDNYELNIGENNGASLIQLQNETELGLSSELYVENNIIRVNISESPIFVKITPTEKSIILNYKKVQADNNVSFENTNVANKNYNSAVSSTQAHQVPNDTLNIKKIMIATTITTIISFISTFFI